MIRSELQALSHSPTVLLRHAADAGAVLGTLGCVELNLQGYPFPGWSTAESRRAVADTLLKELHHQPFRRWGFCAELRELSLEERYLLMERGQLTPTLAARQDGTYVLLSETQDTECYINDEEHLHLQTFRAGAEALPDALQELRELREHFRRVCRSAWDDTFGFLSFDPTKAGAGIFFSFLAYLPGMRLGKHMEQMQRALDELGFFMTPLFAYLEQDMSDLWLIHAPASDANRLESSCSNARKIISDINTRELQIRDKLPELPGMESRLHKSINTALRDLTHATGLRFNRALEIISTIRLGLYYGRLHTENADAEQTAELISRAYTEIAPMHQLHSTGIASPKERRRARASYMKELFTGRLRLTPTL